MNGAANSGSRLVDHDGQAVQRFDAYLIILGDFDLLVGLGVLQIDHALLGSARCENDDPEQEGEGLYSFHFEIVL